MRHEDPAAPALSLPPRLWDTPELGRLSGSTQYLDALLAEVALYNRALSSQEHNRLTGYHHDRYGT